MSKKKKKKIGHHTTSSPSSQAFRHGPETKPSALVSLQLTAAAAAAAKSLQSWPTLCSRIEGSPPGSPVPGTLQARTLEWVAISFSSA